MSTARNSHRITLNELHEQNHIDFVQQILRHHNSWLVILELKRSFFSAAVRNFRPRKTGSC